MKMFDELEREEIRRQYRESGCDESQIPLLAEEYGCCENDILHSLHLPLKDGREANTPAGETDVPSGRAKHYEKYDAQTKKDALRLVMLEHHKQTEVCEMLGIRKTTLKNWVTSARKEQQKYLSAADEPDPAENPDRPKKKKKNPAPDPAPEPAPVPEPAAASGHELSNVSQIFIPLRPEMLAEKHKSAINAAQELALAINDLKEFDEFSDEEFIQLQQFSEQAWSFANGIGYVIDLLKGACPYK